MNNILICTTCPVGCELMVRVVAPGKYAVSGHTCKKGEKYAEQEVTNPQRMLTTTIKIKDGVVTRLPVRSDGCLPQMHIFKYMDIIKLVEKEAPVKKGEVIMKNILNSGVDIIASRSVAKKLEGEIKC